MFSTAQVVKPKKSASSKPAKAVVEMDGLEEYAALCAAIEALEGQKAVFEANIKSEMSDIFVAKGIATGEKPASFDATDGVATGNMQLKVRNSRSKLTEAEQQLLREAGIPFTLNTTIDETFIINPEYAGDMKLLAKVEEALKKVKDLPEDFIQKQEGESCYVATNESINAVFKTGNVEKASKLLPLVSCLAIKAKIKGNFMPVIDRIMEESED